MSKGMSKGSSKGMSEGMSQGMPKGIPKVHLTVPNLMVWSLGGSRLFWDRFSGNKHRVKIDHFYY